MDYSYEESGGKPWKKWLLVGGGIAVGIVLVVAVVLVMRSRAMPVEDEPVMPVDQPAAAVPPPPAGGGPTAVPEFRNTCGDGFCGYPEEDDAVCPVDCLDAEPEILFVSYTQTGPDSVNLEWHTNVPASGSVEYGLSEKYGLGQVKEEQPAFTHAVSIQSGQLKPGSVFFYRITAKDSKNREFSYESVGELGSQ